MPVKQNHASNKMKFNSIVDEVIRIIYFFYKDILHTKKAYKAPKQRLIRYFYTSKSIIKHTGDFHLDIRLKNMKKSK